MPPTFVRSVLDAGNAGTAPVTTLPAGTKAGPGAASVRVDETQPVPSGCLPSMLAEAEPHALAATYSFDAPGSGERYGVAVRFAGSRVGLAGKPGAGDRFERIVRADGLAAGTGRVTLTARVAGINAGEWRVSAAPVVESGTPQAIRRMPRRVIATTTSFGHLVQGPSVRLVAWPVLVGLGAVVAMALQAVLAARAGIGVVSVVALSLVACLLGFGGAKVWYLVLHRKHPRAIFRTGACIQGFLLVSLGVVTVGAAVLRQPPGVLLDATTPGMFLGMAVGRPGCFLTGCCAGRPTGSRWGLWSSDRILGVRRVPVQAVEAAVALLIGVAALTLVLVIEPPVPGAIFVGAIAAYTFSRQLLFPLRMESRTHTGRVATMALCAAVLAAAVGLSLLV